MINALGLAILEATITLESERTPMRWDESESTKLCLEGTFSKMPGERFRKLYIQLRVAAWT
jgi:hypothetical protein